MKPIDWKIHSYRLPLVTGSVRDGLLIQFMDVNGEERWGEVAPFPGRNKETLKEALEQLLQVFNGGKTEKELFPSVQFGLESALCPALDATAPLYALLTGTPDEILQQADSTFDQGYTTVKVKVSSLPLDVARNVIHSLKSQFRIRVDCNSAFSFDEAISLFSPFDPTLFDYIEDPTFEIDRLRDFPYPFALDEKIEEYQTLPLSTYSTLYGFILKPTVLGGKKGCAPLIEYAKKNALKVVFSPVFESGLGLLQILSLAHHFNLLADPIGLDTHRYLKEDLTTIDFSTPLLTVKGSPQIKKNLLTEIAHGKCALPTL